MRFATKAFLAVVGLGLSSIAASPAMASSIPFTFSTTGAFTGPGSSGATVISGGAKIDFSGVAPTVTPPTTVSLGNFSETVIGSGTFSGNSFTLTINQVNPNLASTNGSLTGSLQGTIVSPTSSQVFLDFGATPVTTTSFSTGTSTVTNTFTLTNVILASAFFGSSLPTGVNSGDYLLFIGAETGGDTTISALVTQTESQIPPVPLPASSLGGGALLVLLALAKLRKPLLG